MSTWIKNIFENDSPISIQKMIASLFTIVLIRTFLEFFSNPDKSGFIFGWETSYLHFPLFYFSLFLAISIFLFFLTKENFNRIWNFLIPVFFIIILPPIIDLFITKGEGSAISYIATEPENIFSIFIKFLYFSNEPGITFGIRIAGFLLLLAVGIFILIKTRNLLKTAIGISITYIYLFLCAIIPSIVALPYYFSENFISAKNLYYSAINQGLIQTTRQALPASLTTIEQHGFFHAIFMSQVFWLFLVFQLFIIFIILNKKYLKTFKDNFPITRVLYWTMIALIGVFLSQKNYVSVDLKNITTIISFCSVFTLGVLNTLFAVCINDAEDIRIDTISNPKRPLASKEFSVYQWNNFALILFALIILGLSTMNSSVVFFLVMTQMLYFIYSARPLRLKRNFIFSSFIIGLASATVAMTGFFFTSTDQHLSAFPTEVIFLIVFTFGIFSNVKDIKDFEGDKTEGIKTIPVVFGLENSKKIIAGLYSLVFISLPIIMELQSMFIFSILCCLFTFYLFIKKQYQEKYIFLILFLYASMLFLAII